VQTFGSVLRTTGGGQAIVGCCVSLTVTVNEQFAVLPDASLTEQLTVVMPLAKTEPLAGAHIGVPTPAQLSITIGAAYVTTAEHWFGSVPWMTGDGQVIVGGVVSVTVTVKLQDCWLPVWSVTEQVTVVVPTAKDEPEAGEHVGVQLPVTVGGG
jgi:hypothetical protein